MDTQIDKARSEATFHYRVKNFSKMEYRKVSPPCYVCDLPWKIVVKPCYSQTQEREKSLGFYLECNRESNSDFWRCYADAELRLLSNKEGEEPFSMNIQHIFCRLEDDWGFSEFMPWQEVLEVERGYIKNDSIMLEVHVVAEHYENRVHRILVETKQEMSTAEVSMKQRQQEVVEKIQMLKGDIDEREERRGAAFASLSEESKRDTNRVESNMRQWKQEIVEKIEMLKGDADKREERRKATSEERKNEIFEETKQEMGRVELGMRQWIVEKIEMLRGDIDEREEKRRAAFASLSEESKRDTNRVESNMRQWKQEIVEKIEKLGADMIKETEKRKFRETMMRKDEKKEKKKRQKQLEVNKWEEMEERIENMQKAVQKKSMFITGLGILIFIILNGYILPGCLYMYPRIA